MKNWIHSLIHKYLTTLYMKCPIVDWKHGQLLWKQTW